jgi:hypothetical protein
MAVCMIEGPDFLISRSFGILETVRGSTALLFHSYAYAKWRGR